MKLGINKPHIAKRGGWWIVEYSTPPEPWEKFDRMVKAALYFCDDLNQLEIIKSKIQRRIKNAKKT